VVLPRKHIDAYHALATLEAMWLPKDRSVATFLDLFTTTNPERAGAGMGYDKWKLAIGRKYFDIGSRIATRCRHLVCISEKTKQDVMDSLKVPERRLKVIRLGISEHLQPQPKRDNVFRIGTLGQLDKRKRIDLLVKQFKASHIDAELVVAGQGMDRPMLEGLANGDKRIKFLGLVPESQICDFYNSLDLFVFPTFIEGYGLPLAEAMACKKPAMVMADAIIPVELKKRCIVVGNLTSVFDNPPRLFWLMGKVDYESNYQFAKEHSWDKCLDQYEQLYKEIAN
jgi:glycosyltransferase involved in cell wall biosynthesis